MAANQTQTECFFLLDEARENMRKLCLPAEWVREESFHKWEEFASGPDMDKMWILLAGAIVFFMQTGFSMLEAGAVKRTNVQNILFKNIMDACVGAIVWFLFGYCLAYGDPEDSNAFIGVNNVAIKDGDWNAYFFQWAFAGTAATIVSGSVAERCTLHAYFIYTIFLTAWTYPVVAHWVWSAEGWLSISNPDAMNGGVLDFAGSGVVHSVGGWSGLCGALALGPRLRRFDSKEASDDLKRLFNMGWNVPFQMLGTFILWFGWYAFNCGSTLVANGAMQTASLAAVTTSLGAASGGLVAAFGGLYIEGYFHVPRICNGILAGLVSVTSASATVDEGSAILIGAIGAALYYSASKLLEKLKVDDPLDAWPVHGCGGVWGLLAASLFSTDELLELGGFPQQYIDLGTGERFGNHLLAAVCIVGWTLVMSGGSFFVMQKVGLMRIDEHIEMEGIDMHEHGGGAVSQHGGYTVRGPLAQFKSKRLQEKGIKADAAHSGEGGAEEHAADKVPLTQTSQATAVEHEDAGEAV